jgi:DNA-directed RNA polymerase specialized sigma subunit
VPGSANSNAPKVRHAFPAFDAAAKALNLTTEQLREKLSDHKTTIADVAKQQNVDINTVIDAMTQADRDRIEDMVNKPWPARDRGPGGPGAFGPGGGKHGGMGFGILGRFGAGFDDLAGALNTTTDQLKTDLRDGKTIKEIAEANNVDVNTVINKIVDAANKRIDEAVSNGKLTKEQGDKIKSEVKEHVTEFVNNGLPNFPRFGPRGGNANTP